MINNDIKINETALRDLILKWRSEANGCDTEGVMSSLAGVCVERSKAKVLNSCAKDLEKILDESIKVGQIDW